MDGVILACYLLRVTHSVDSLPRLDKWLLHELVVLIILDLLFGQIDFEFVLIWA